MPQRKGISYMLQLARPTNWFQWSSMAQMHYACIQCLQDKVSRIMFLLPMIGITYYCTRLVTYMYFFHIQNNF
jgi:hypothetical protein